MKVSLKVLGFFLVFLTALCWGPNFLFIKVILTEIHPVTLVFYRVGIGALTIFLITVFKKIDLWKWRSHWKNFCIMGLTMNVIPFTCISLSEVHISSALTGILNSLAVISTAIIAHFFGPHDPLTKNRMLGIISGVVGLVVLNLPMLSHQNLGNLFGVFLMVVAGLCYGVGIVYVRTHLQKIPPLAALSYQLIASTIMLFFLSLIIDRSYHLPLSLDVLYSILALGAIGTGISFIFYYKAIHLAGGTFATLSVFLVAIFAMILGGIFLHEPITWNLYVGAFFILAGLLAVNPVFDKSL